LFVGKKPSLEVFTPLNCNLSKEQESILLKQLKQKTMKTKSLALTAMAILVAATVFATNFPTMNIIPVQKEKALVAIESASPSEFELSLQNSNGETLYYKKSEKPVQTFTTLFNLHELESGQYEVTLTSGNCKLTREVSISKDGKIKVGEEITQFAPCYRFEDNLLKVSYLNNKLRHVNLSIYQDGMFIAGRKLGKDLCIQKIFDLSKLEHGEYEVVVSDRVNEYAFLVEK
jgi:hypothetical protein